MSFCGEAELSWPHSFSPSCLVLTQDLSSSQEWYEWSREKDKRQSLLYGCYANQLINADCTLKRSTVKGGYTKCIFFALRNGCKLIYILHKAGLLGLIHRVITWTSCWGEIIMKIEFQLHCTDGISPPGPTRSVLVLTFCLRTQSGYIKLHDFPDKRIWTSQNFTLLRRKKGPHSYLNRHPSKQALSDRVGRRGKKVKWLEVLQPGPSLLLGPQISRESLASDLIFFP